MIDDSKTLGIFPEHKRRPGPLFCGADKFGPYRVSLNVAQDGQQMGIALDTETFKSTLPDVAARFVAGMRFSDMGSQQPLHEATDVGCLVGGDAHVKMVGHQAKGKDLNGMAYLGFCDEVDE